MRRRGRRAEPPLRGPRLLRSRTARGGPVAAVPAFRTRARGRRRRPRRARALQGPAARPVRVDRTAVGAGQPGRRHRHGRLRVRPGPRPRRSRRSARVVPHEGGPGLQHDRHRPRRTPRCTGRCSSAATCSSSTSAAPAGPSRSTARRSRTSKGRLRARGGSCGRQPRATGPTTTRPRCRPTTWPRWSRALGLGPVDVYGDSYGTFFAQVYAGRHPEQVRSVVLDSAYPTYGEDAWYATQGPAMRDSFAVVCQRTPVPAGTPAGRSCPTLEKVLAEVRTKPVARHGVRRGRPPDAGHGRRRGRWSRSRSARRTRRRSTASSPRRSAPALSGDRRAAAPAGRRGHRRRHRRRAGQRLQRGARRGGRLPRLPAALRHDRATGGPREQQYAAALDARATPAAGHLRPVHGPRVRRLRLADARLVHAAGRSAPASNPAGPPVPPSAATTPTCPVLVLSGELDSITTPAEGRPGRRAVPERQARHRRQQLPRHRGGRHRRLRGPDRALVRHVARRVDPGPAACAAPRNVAPVRAHRAASRAALSPVDAGSGAVAAAAALDRRRPAGPLVEQLRGHGVGLRGGTWTLHRRPRWCGSGWPAYGSLPDLRGAQAPRSGTGTRATMTVSLDLPRGHLAGSWDTRTPGRRRCCRAAGRPTRPHLAVGAVVGQHGRCSCHSRRDSP